jgi:hypothetical protein
MFLVFFLYILSCITARFTEEERVENWRKHHKWPPEWQHEPEGFKALMEEREREIMELTGSDERWENWMQYVSARLLPTFTEKGKIRSTE